MICPDCKKEVELSHMDPSVSRVRVEGTTVRADVEIGDLCAECCRVLLNSKTEAERGLKDVPVLKSHLDHKWRVELLKSERILEPAGYGSAKLSYVVTCECGSLPAYPGTLFSSSKLATVS